jgi:hypothetical protein
VRAFWVWSRSYWHHVLAKGDWTKVQLNTLWIPMYAVLFWNWLLISVLVKVSEYIL